MLDFSLKYFRAINYLLGAAILISALMLTRNIVNISFSDKDLTKPVSPPSASKSAAPAADIMRYAVILERNPFGPPLTMEPITTPETTETRQYGPLSDLILTGTAVGPEKLSYAVIINKKVKTDGQEIFTYGDNVFNYGVLTKIEKEAIELTRDNIAYTIRLPVEEVPLPATEASVHTAAIARKIGDREYVLDSRKVRQSLDNPEKLLTDARLLPNFVDGKQKGFRISEVKPEGLYHNLGLKNGDILLRINGLAISNPEVAIQAMSALRGMNSVDLDIIRDNNKMSMSYKIR